ncbi:hypothetical protein PDQ79_23515 [Bacillus cereus]|uniref:Uncharacterized protein n=1 Tax=Bacillus fungorum TaxID=2039284 RepID=A0A2G6Q7H0_9BACI|nr:hypothetical protein [Bacillus fungorum]MDA2637470.1 hypothetical protein [Bacillus cereus]PIE92768.1 hypothetical protein CO726_24695 [Bacillus fungorum]
MNQESILKQLEKVVEHNNFEMEKVKGNQCLAENLIVIDYEERSVYDPFFDESGRFEVNPIQYYGLKNIIKMIEAY